MIFYFRGDQAHGCIDAGDHPMAGSCRVAQAVDLLALMTPVKCELMNLGHQVRLIPPAYVKPYVKRGKTDAADTEAMCEAVGRPTMCFVAVETPEQQAVLLLHKTRDLPVRSPYRSLPPEPCRLCAAQLEGPTCL